MLVLTRKKEQSIVIDGNIEVTLLDIQGDCVKLGIQAPKSVSIHRKEIFIEIQLENKRASEVANVSFKDVFKKN